ncbi:PAS domain-containing sensor histidine kinase [Psychroserpens luteus]|uniref:histidine kinase n=1 Tax=Psychroserpens luteus TaxID=1434066 RepID=A0ABW5ZXA6_9FLAO|nr:PAS domain S-box protein [Psychroserpens luteus]
MKNLERSIKKRYLLFISTIVIIIIFGLIIIQNSVSTQKNASLLINKASNQCMLSESITRLVFSFENNPSNTISSDSISSLKNLINAFENSHNYLYSINKQKGENNTLDSLLKRSNTYLTTIVTSSKNIINNPNTQLISRDIKIIAETESPYFLTMQTAIREYQKAAEKNLDSLKSTMYFLAFIAGLILTGEFLFILVPALKQLFKQNDKLTKANKDLAKSESKVKANILELTNLKTDLETRETYNKVFIEQAPTAIAMLDSNMCYIAASQRWITDYKMERQDIIGRSHYDLFPEIGDDWKANHQKCLRGAIDICDEAPFVRADGTTQWIFWDVRPWYISEGNVGGLIMHTGDITHIKEKEEEKIRIEKILDKTNEVARIGTWDIDLIKNTVFWSKIIFEIHEVTDDFVPDLETGIHFYKEGENRNTIKKVINEAIELGRSFDVELELVTFKGNSVWVRAMAQAEIVDGQCIRLFGVFQDISSKKNSEIELNKANAELKVQQAHNKIFIEQAPMAIAMVDNNMRYLAVSQRWITDYDMEGQEFIGRSHYELFPEIGDDWKAMHQRCLNGAIDINNEEPFIRTDGSLQWITWDVRPWYDSDGNIGGILMQTGDITHIKENEQEKIQIQKILDKTNEVARIGAWEINLVKDRIFWSKMVRDIHEVTEDYEPDLETAINFFKEGESRNTIQKVVQKAIENGTPYDIEIELVTLNGNILWTRAIGQAEFVDGKCIRLFGVFQDINDKKLSQLALNKAHTELEAIFNSESVAIVATQVDGIISQFNRGAEILTGYSASEMVGLQRPIAFHLREELDDFRIDMAKKYGKSPVGFSAQKEMSKHNAFDTREWHYLRKDGSLLPAQLTLTSMKDEKGELIGYLGIAVDISEKRIAQDELLRKNKLLNFAEEITLMGNWQWDTVTDKVEWSNNLYNIFKLDKGTANLNFDTYFNFVHPDDKDIVTEYFDKTVDEKRLNRFTHRIIAGDGKLKFIQLLGEVITNDEGEVIEMVGTCQDVTEQKMAENKFRGLLESAPDAMVIVNEIGEIQLINKQAEKLFGYSAEELFGESVEILIPRRFAGNHTSDRDGFFSNPNARRMGEGKELFGINKEGNEIPIQISLSPLETEEGLLVSAAIRDITVQKLAQTKIIRAKNDLELLAQKLTIQNNQLADFAHITSHNLRAPVSNLNSLLDFYNESEDEDEKLILFEKFEIVIQHLTVTLNTLVDALKTKNMGSQDLEDIMFNEILDKTKEILIGEILKTGAIITSDFSKMPNITYDRIYLESIFLNLLSNTLKYRSEARVPEIFIESEIVDGKIKLKFKDNGLGIDLEKHGHKLFGLNKVFHRHPDAKGVGLFMTKVQIESMGGVITATSKVNEGSTFNINFN